MTARRNGWRHLRGISGYFAVALATFLVHGLVTRWVRGQEPSLRDLLMAVIFLAVGSIWIVAAWRRMRLRKVTEGLQGLGFQKTARRKYEGVVLGVPVTLSPPRLPWYESGVVPWEWSAPVAGLDSGAAALWKMDGRWRAPTREGMRGRSNRPAAMEAFLRENSGWLASQLDVVASMAVTEGRVWLVGRKHVSRQDPERMSNLAAEFALRLARSFGDEGHLAD